MNKPMAKLQLHEGMPIKWKNWRVKTCQTQESLAGYAPMTKTLVIKGRLPLTDQQVKILRMIAQGKGSKQIAQELGCSPKTVDAHKNSIKDRLGLVNHRELTIAACKHTGTKESNPSSIETALGGKIYWRDLAIQLAQVWWELSSIKGSLQHGELDAEGTMFSVVLEEHGGQCFHGETPHDAWQKAKAWLLSPSRRSSGSMGSELKED